MNLWRITFKGYPANVWQVPAYNKHANLWIAKVAGVVKTKDEAQALVDAEVQAAQAAWDALSEEEKDRNESKTCRHNIGGIKIYMSTYKGIRGLKVRDYTTNPDNPIEGQLWYNKTDQVGKYQIPNVTASWRTGNNLNTG